MSDFTGDVVTGHMGQSPSHFFLKMVLKISLKLKIG